MRQLNLHIAVVTAIAALSTLWFTSVPAMEDGAERYATVRITVSPDSAKAGELIELAVNFSTDKDIHVTSDPPLEFKLAKGTWFSLHGTPTQEIDSSNGYLSTSSPVRQKFLISKNARLGKQRIAGSLIYYLCSDPEGWCRKFQETISLDIVIEK